MTPSRCGSVVLGQPMSLEREKASDRETWAAKCPGSICYPFLSHHHNRTLAGQPRQLAMAAPDSGSTSYVQGLTASPGLEPRPHVQEVGIPTDIHPLPQGGMVIPPFGHPSRDKPVLCLGHSRSSTDVYGRTVTERQQRTLHSSKEMCS